MKRISLAGKWSVLLGENYFDFDGKVDSYHPTQIMEEVELGQSDLLNSDEIAKNIDLPGTTDEAKLGKYNARGNDIHLKREYPFVGTCLYKKSFDVPDALDGYAVFFSIERTKSTVVYLDGIEVSSSNSMLTKQTHLLSTGLKAGRHELAVKVTNNMLHIGNGYENFASGHQFTEHTQTNWNGMLGEIELNFSKPILSSDGLVAMKMSNVTYEYKPKEASIGFNVALEGYSNDSNHKITSDVLSPIFEVGLNQLSVSISRENCKYDKVNHVYEFEVPLSSFFNGEDSITQWSEFDPVVYPISIDCILDEQVIDRHDRTIGFNEVGTHGHELRHNGRRIHLRGDLDCSIYPLTGYAPMDYQSWHDKFKTMKTYGVNHCRYHSWCPPEAAFDAADDVGIYLQVELPCFANVLDESTEIFNQLLLTESKKVIDAYGHHPSFILFAVGNELDGEPSIFESMVRELKTYRNDMLFCGGSNNFIDKERFLEEDEYFVGMRLPEVEGEHSYLVIRGSYSHANLPLGHIQMTDYVGANESFDSILGDIDRPIIAHEISQFQFCPIRKEIDKYNGVLTSPALEQWAEAMDKNNLRQYESDFFEAAGKLSIDCYKEDIESALRSNRMSGFQLLSLMDFSGQGTALVGILDSFYDSKGLIEPSKWRQFCAPTVIMAAFESSILTWQDQLATDLLLYHYNDFVIENGICEVTLIADGVDMSDRSLSIVLDKKEIEPDKFPVDETSSIGKVVFDFNEYYEKIINQLSMNGVSLSLEIKLIDSISKEQICENAYRLFLYDNEKVKQQKTSKSFDVYNQIDEVLIEKLKSGKNVLIQVDQQTQLPLQDTFYPTDFWNYTMFKLLSEEWGLPVAPGTMGFFIKEQHPIFNNFYTRSHGEIQWKRMVNDGKTIRHSLIDDQIKNLLIESNAELTPIVHVIDHFQKNDAMGMIYEITGLEGRCVVTSIDFASKKNLPEAQCLLSSIEQYLGDHKDA